VVVVVVASAMIVSTAFAWMLDPSSILKSPSRHHYHHRNRRRRRSSFLQQHDGSSPKDEESNKMEFYDDFGDACIGDTPTKPTKHSLLQDRLQQLAQSEQAQEQQIADNWKEGFWNVWGCSLDPYPPSSATQNDDIVHEKTVVTCIRVVPLQDEDDDAVQLIVGRSDGSLVVLKMDTSTATPKSQEPPTVVTYFENKLSAKPTDDGGMTLGSALQRSNDVDANDDDDDALSTTIAPFDILAQVAPVSSPREAIIDMMVLPEVGQLWTVSEQVPPAVKIWKLTPYHDSDFLVPANENPETMVSCYDAIIMGMKAIPNSNEVAIVYSDGQVSILTVTPGISMRFEGNLLEQHGIDPDEKVVSVDVDDQYLYLGCGSGQILIFSLQDEGPTLPLVKSFVAFTDRNPAVTALCVAAPGTLNESLSPTTPGRPPRKTLIAGTAMGALKQWELIPTNNGLEYWPRMDSQKLPGKAHKFATAQDELTDENVPFSLSIRQIMCVQKVVLAATNNRLQFWDPATGKGLFEMQGLDFVAGTAFQGLFSRPSLAVAGDSCLVTNGMGQYVCVHDFASERVTSENAQDMIQPDDDA
jgi:hypothetical protein